MSCNGFHAGGEWSLQTAIERKVRQTYAREIELTSGYWEKRKLEREIRQKINEETKRQINPYMVW